MEIGRIRNTLKENRTKLAMIIREIGKIKTVLKEEFNDDDYKWLEQVMEKIFIMENKEMKDSHKKKFEKLIEERRGTREEQKRIQD